jgi:hypothetical protein
VTDCATGDINYNLCVALTERIDAQQAILVDVRHAVAWTVGVLLFALVVLPLLQRIRTGDETKV